MSKFLEQGVRQAVEKCLRLRPEESVVIITDRETLGIGSALRDAVEKITPRVKFFIKEDFGSRPLAFPKELESALAEADVSIYAAKGAPGELQIFRMPMLDCVNRNKKLRHGHMINITPEIMADGMCSDYEEIGRITRLVYDKVKDVRLIRVVTEKGTDFTAEFSPKLKWKLCDGLISPDSWSNLPDGELFTAPVNVNGRAIIDGCLGDFFTGRYGSIEKTPMFVEIKDGRAVRESIKSENGQMEKEFIEYLFEMDENSNRVGEFAIGTNIGLTRLIGNLLQDEKFPGVHIAFGSPYPEKTGADWDSKGHVDGVIQKTTVFVGGEMIMDKGRFVF